VSDCPVGHAKGTDFWSGYHLDDLYQATARTRLQHRPGSHVHYSNFGIGLLEQLLANAANSTSPDLFLDRVCRPIGMTNTLTGPCPSCATGYRRGRPMPAWEMGALAAADTLRSDATDLLLPARPFTPTHHLPRRGQRHAPSRSSPGRPVNRWPADHAAMSLCWLVLW
jgi:CubicO group peptidase (beta-lactamase class C family)